MKVALVHEWFTALAGSEKVVEQILASFPEADVFCVYADPATVRHVDFLKHRKITTTFIQKLPGAAKRYRSYLPLMPLAVEQLDLSNYDVIISSAHAVAKGVLTGPDQLHISYVHSPIRYAWDLQHQYLRESGLASGLKSWLARWLLHRIRMWDYRTAAGVDYFVANSKFIARRIEKVYRRESTVIYPPVAVEDFSFSAEKEDFYLAASRLVPYKRMDLIVKAFSQMPDKRLLVIGDGPEMANLRKLAAPNVTLLGYQPFASLVSHMQRAKAFVFAAEEDFGILPVEAQACGTPVIAFGKGGACETVISSANGHSTGVLFPEQTVESLIEGVARFEAQGEEISAYACRANAEQFSNARFRHDFEKFVTACWARFQRQMGAEPALHDIGPDATERAPTLTVAQNRRP